MDKRSVVTAARYVLQPRTRWEYVTCTTPSAEMLPQRALLDAERVHRERVKSTYRNVVHHVHNSRLDSGFLLGNI